MPSFADSIFLFVLALLLFGPKKLPVLARELGKWVGEFRRASNEFKMQMEEELRVSEQADRQKQIAAMEAAAPVPPPLTESPEEEHPHLRPPATTAVPLPLPEPLAQDNSDDSSKVFPPAADKASVETPNGTVDGVRPLPIASSGSLHMMPPATGLPTPRGRHASPLGGGFLSSIPEAPAENSPVAEVDREMSQEAAHGD